MVGPRRGTYRVAIGCAFVALWLGACGPPAGLEADRGPGATEGATTTPLATTPTPHPSMSTFRSVRGHEEVARPIRLRIPAIGVDTGLEDLARATDLSIEVPREPQSAGWWTEGPRPGQVGPAVLLGHVDSRSGPAVFFRLAELRPGDDVLVDRADGSTATFRVTGLDRFPKDEFPSDLVYYPTLEPHLRLVTCGGQIDPATGHYRDNVIAFASLSA